MVLLLSCTRFSLRIAKAGVYSSDDDDGSGGGGELWLPRPLLADFVAALPTSCFDFELDTKGHDSAGPGAPAHECDALRAILPRLRHLRLRVRLMRPAIFIAGSGESGR